jgi:hypothetical protein
MAVGVKKGMKAPSAANLQAMADADVFVREGRQRKESQKNYEIAKGSLLDWLGDDISKNLPDGRVVSQAHTPFAEATINRKAYVATNLTVGPPPAE